MSKAVARTTWLLSTMEFEPHSYTPSRPGYVVPNGCSACHPRYLSAPATTDARIARTPGRSDGTVARAIRPRPAVAPQVMPLSVQMSAVWYSLPRTCSSNSASPVVRNSSAAAQ